MDAVSARDHIQEAVSVASILASNLSRLAAELILWSTKEFSRVKLSDDWSTGSSIMPQKRNPDAAAQTLLEAIEQELATLLGRGSKRILKDRYIKYRNMGEYSSHFKVAVANEISQLQGYVAQGVRVIKRRRRSKRNDSPKS